MHPVSSDTLLWSDQVTPQAPTAASWAASGIGGGGGFAGGAPMGKVVRVQSGMTSMERTPTSPSSVESSGPG